MTVQQNLAHSTFFNASPGSSAEMMLGVTKRQSQFVLDGSQGSSSGIVRFLTLSSNGQGRTARATARISQIKQPRPNLPQNFALYP